MAVQTGRTVSKWCKFAMDDSAGTMRDIPVNSVNGIGLTFDEVDLTAFQDAVKGALQGHPDFVLTISGPYDTSATQAASGSAAAAALSGSHTVLKAILAQVVAGTDVPLAFAFYVGNRHYWETGEDVFGLAASATNGMRLFDYQFDPGAGTYTAKFRMNPGSAVPAWGTSAIT